MKHTKKLLTILAALMLVGFFSCDLLNGSCFCITTDEYGNVDKDGLVRQDLDTPQKCDAANTELDNIYDNGSYTECEWVDVAEDYL